VALSYSAEQAARGAAAYTQSCVQCHGESLNDGALGAPLKGPEFMQKFGGKSVEELFTLTRTTMPTDNPGSLDTRTYAELVAFLLEANDVVPGEAELPADPRRLAAMTIPEGGFSFMAFSPYTPRALVDLPNPLDAYTEVTDGLLESPPPGDWLSWRRTYDAHGFSPLSQIDKTNVRDLRLVWSWSLPAGSNEAIPLVHDGVMFTYGFGDVVQALDAATGDLLWQYTHTLEEGAPLTQKRAIGLYGNRVYLGTSDAHVVALDAATGEPIWDRVVGDFRVRESISAGPLLARGKVMVGTTGTGVGAVPGGPQIVGLDAATGEIAWRVHTIAQPGTPGGDSWNGMPIEQRSGASVWTAGSYAPSLGLAYFGTGNTYDTGPLMPPLDAPGVSNDALYTDSTLAIDPDTGSLTWYFQHLPNDQWDLDWAFERQLIELPVLGAMRTVAITAGKLGIYDGLDAATGEYLFSIDLGLQNVVTAIDPETGDKTIDPDLVPGDGEIKLVCPHGAGAKSYLPASYNAATKMLFVPLVESCMDIYPVPGGGVGALSSGVNWGVRPIPDSDGNYGRLQAIDLDARELSWTVRQRAPQTSGVLATAGGLVFAAAMDRRIRAYDDANGEALWEARLNDVSSSSPMTFSVNGRQFVSVVVGEGGFQARSYAPLVPELRSPPNRGASIWTFALPTDEAD
jgi:alcohol dehydrogenase (cytochrome c)